MCLRSSPSLLCVSVRSTVPRECDDKSRSPQKLNGGSGLTPAHALVSATPLVNVDGSPPSHSPPVAEHAGTNPCREVRNQLVRSSQVPAGGSLAPSPLVSTYLSSPPVGHDTAPHVHSTPLDCQTRLTPFSDLRPPPGAPLLSPYRDGHYWQEVPAAFVCLDPRSNASPHHAERWDSSR